MALSLEAIASELPRRTVVVLGDLVCDEYVYGETERVSREAPVLVVRYEASERRPGGAGNAAANLAALGVRTRVVGVTGVDDEGQAVVGALRDQGASVHGVLALPERRTDTKMRILAGGKNTRRQQMLRLDRGQTAALSARTERQLLAALREACEGADALLVSDYGSGTCSPAVIAQVRRLARRGVTVCADSRHNLGAFSGVQVVKPNESELELASGIRTGDDALAFERAGRAFLRTLRCGAVLVTRGRSGMALFRAGEPTEQIAAHGSSDAVDVTGAGDTVMAAFTAALAASGDVLASARIANVAGALCVKKPGTAVVTQEELCAELALSFRLGRNVPAKLRRARG